MAYKQPRVPTMKEGTNLYGYIRELVLFLKDFCLETWTESKRHSDELSAVRKELEALKDEIAGGNQ